MDMREKWLYIDKMKNAVEKNDYESFQRIFNELQGNYLNIAPLMLLKNINNLILSAKNIRGCFRTHYYGSANPQLWETISAVLEHLNESSKIMQNYMNKHHEKDK
ncbi:hypothetical protein [Photorhabdus akhurstii]|uniref:Orf28 n=1 Tax=Photorhabdus luminescens TaxID=29488 RepID=Q8GFA7_PHOLU|nr:hypothetical protein [Photorhabdus akhurstii]AAO17194.1 Orf28 [Photorhabdus luminescens]KGM28685.1 hypothetical protein KS18_06480 [Photorhabdus luminescens]MBS9428690.1 hypothetical protein [Photorhabdus akhurstii]PQQ33236.1 hypothetical protein C6H69_11605 [Photorhabdus luminescens]